MAILPAVGAGGVEAEQRHARSGFFEVDAVAAAVDRHVEVTPQDRLDALGLEAPRLRHPGYCGVAAVAHQIHSPMERPGVLHRDERVALEHKAGHAHQHRENVVVERLGSRRQELVP